VSLSKSILDCKFVSHLVYHIVLVPVYGNMSEVLVAAEIMYTNHDSLCCHNIRAVEDGIKDDEVCVYLNYHEYLMLYDMEM
jgi:hypothetical protein